jgi:hypothetical protein
MGLHDSVAVLDGSLQAWPTMGARQCNRSRPDITHILVQKISLSEEDGTSHCNNSTQPAKPPRP